jgi:hypothetical protein
MKSKSLSAVVEICSLITFHAALKEETTVEEYLAEQFRTVPQLYCPSVPHEHYQFCPINYENDEVRAFTW